MFELHVLQNEFGDALMKNEDVVLRIRLWLGAFAIFAFMLTLVREIAKDVEDMDGDREGSYRTLPILWGIEKSKKYMLILEVATLTMVLAISWFEFSQGRYARKPIFAIFWGIILPMGRAIYLTARAKEKEDFTSVSRSLKLTMLCGVLSSALLAMAFEEGPE